MPVARRWPRLLGLGALVRGSCSPRSSSARAVLDARLPTADTRVVPGARPRVRPSAVRDVTPASAFADRARKAIADYLHREQLSIDDGGESASDTSGRNPSRLTPHRRADAFRDRSRGAPAARHRTDGSRSFGSQLAVHLGYSEESTFYSAFSRWTGSLPRAGARESSRTIRRRRSSDSRRRRTLRKSGGREPRAPARSRLGSCDRLGSQESSWAGLEGARPTSRFHARARPRSVALVARHHHIHRRRARVARRVLARNMDRVDTVDESPARSARRSTERSLDLPIRGRGGAVAEVVDRLVGGHAGDRAGAAAPSRSRRRSPPDSDRASCGSAARAGSAWR